MIGRGTLLHALVSRGSLDPVAAGRIAHRDEVARGDEAPWYLQALVIIGAWLASIFLLVFMSLLTGGKRELLGTLGFTLLCAVVFTRQMHVGLFVRQFALATAFCAQLMGVGFAHDLASAAALATIVSAMLYFLYPDARHRFLSPLLPAVLVLAWMASENELRPLMHFLVLAEALAIGIAFVGRPHPALRPLGLSMACALCATLITMQYFTPLWPSQVILTFAVMWLTVWVADGRPSPAVLLGVAALGALSTPGIMFGIGLVALGVVRGNRLLASAGCLFLTHFIIFFYYWMDVDLATKSWILISTGGVVLVARSMLTAMHPHGQDRAAPPSVRGGGTAVFLSAAALVLTALNLMIWQKEQVIRHGRVVLLELAPADPRSLMQGDYMRLAYGIERDLEDGSQRSGGRVVVRVDANGVGRFVRHDASAAAPDEQVLAYHRADGRLRIGPDAWYFQEGDAEVYGDARYGELRCDAGGNCVLVGLRDSRYRELRR